jgi:hypothetical protein
LVEGELEVFNSRREAERALRGVMIDEPTGRSTRSCEHGLRLEEAKIEPV